MIFAKYKTIIEIQFLKSLCKHFLTILIILIVYQNSLNSLWHLDDSQNILYNKTIHIDNLSTQSIIKAFISSKRNDIYFRPLANISFSINWYFSNKETISYHIINLSLHIISFIILSFFSFELLKNFIPENIKNQNIFFISFLSASLWALNPIQTQCVTYIVQRMAQMAALFYLLAMFSYLKARTSETVPGDLFPYHFTHLFYYGLTFFFFCCAILSKENAILLPVSLLLMEFIFFQSNKHLIALSVLIVVAGVLVIILFGKGNFFFFLNGYAYREYTLTERLLTESRVVLFYLSQILYPLPSRLSIAHDIQLSTNLFNPLTTLPSILIIFFLIGGAIYYRKKTPLFSFAILFFFLNHIVESTILPLELIFEHRNYLPSMFLFLPVASGISNLLDRYESKNKLIYWGIFITTTCSIIAFGKFTYERNKAWQSPETLWYDAFQKAPGNARANNNLATVLGWGENTNEKKRDVALKLLERSLSMPQERKYLNADSMANMALIHFERENYAKALELQKKALDINPNRLKTRFEYVKTLFMMGSWDDASTEIDALLKKAGENANPEYVYFKGFILLWQDHDEEALSFFQMALKNDPYNRSKILFGTACALSNIGAFQRADRFYKLAQEKTSPSVQLFLKLIENSVKANNKDQAIQYGKVMFDQFSVYEILRNLKEPELPYKTFPMDRERISPVIKTLLSDIGKEAEEKRIL